MPKTQPQRKVLAVTLMLLLCDHSDMLVVWRVFFFFYIKAQQQWEQELPKLMDPDCIMQGTLMAFILSICIDCSISVTFLILDSNLQGTCFLQ